MSAASSGRRSFCYLLSPNASEMKTPKTSCPFVDRERRCGPSSPSVSPPGGTVVWIFINFQLGVLNWHQSFGSRSIIKLWMTPLGLPALPAFTWLAFRAQTPITFSSRDQFEGYPRESAQATKQIVLFFDWDVLSTPSNSASWECGRETTAPKPWHAAMKKEGTSRGCKHCSDWNPVNEKKMNKPLARRSALFTSHALQLHRGLLKQLPKHLGRIGLRAFWETLSLSRIRLVT